MSKLIVANLCQYLLKYTERLLCADKDRWMVGNNSGTPKMKIYYIHKVKLPEVAFDFSISDPIPFEKKKKF